jgi:AmmeMemoRadiSam system protein A
MAGLTSIPLSVADGDALVRLAAETVRRLLCGLSPDGRPPRAAALRRLGCSFVTLERQGLLRGCIGSLEAGRPLYRDVARNAGRAMVDPRLDPVSADEWLGLEVSVSVLSPAEPVLACGFAELSAMLRPYVDGLIVTVGGQQATFLPAVWHKLPDPTEFLAALLAKGGWHRDRLPAGARVRRYTATEFHDAYPRTPLVPSG